MSSLHDDNYFRGFNPTTLRYYFLSLIDIPDRMGETEPAMGVDQDSVQEMMESVKDKCGDQFVRVVIDDPEYLICRSKDSGITLDMIINKTTLQKAVIEVY